MAQSVPNASGVRIMGPIVAQMYQVRGFYRMRFLVCGDARSALQPIVKLWMSRVNVPANIRVKLDGGPQNVM